MAPWSMLAERAAAGGKRLAVIGGRLEDDNVAIYGEMHRLSGGRILVFPTASGEPREVGKETVAAFRGHGFEAEVCDLHAGNAARAAFDPRNVAMIGDYRSVYFTGGDQSKIVDALIQKGAETPVLAAIRAAHTAGGLIAGSSAGAAMMSGPMILGGTSLESVVHGITTDPSAPGLLMGQGLGFFEYGMVDQHFIKRGRLGRLIVGMEQAGVRGGFGVDENTALLVEGDVARVCGEYGVMLVDYADHAEDEGEREFRLSYVDDGDWIDLTRLRAYPGAAKRRVRKREVAYRAPANSRRNVFGAYALYDLMARLVLGDPEVYTEDQGEALDVKTGVNATVALERARRISLGMIATPETGLRMTALNFRARLLREQLSATRVADRAGRRGWSFGAPVNPAAPMVLLGSSPLSSDATGMLGSIRDLMGAGEIGVIAAASAEPARTAAEHVRMLERNGLRGVDLGVTIDTVEYVSADPDQLNRIAELDAILLCGGNQIRLVETMLHRGEESGVLRAIARAHSRGAVLIAPSGAAAALSSVMIAGGTSEEALRYGVTSDLGHPGLVIQEGIGLFGSGIIDQNLISSGRLGRLVVACAEENERFGIGVCEDSAVVCREGGTVLEARGRHGFVLVDTLASDLTLHSDSFVARGIRLTLIGPGDSVSLSSGAVARAPVDRTARNLLERLVANLARDVGAPPNGGSAARRAHVRMREHDALTAILDLESPRDEFD
ncbi:MAG: cyanophycinase [Rhodovulum sulfidophilum]|uniref:Cyanophycinase n=1 Tax=Rhodovulum sulfidophilum TaxID=35806 RepID=A0A2W5NDN6_RHOSU|nr:MAG: cyanophycinase [Rhodovulum sulfidophilum]